MKQTSLSASGFELQSKRTRKREFLSEMDRVIPWADLVALIQPHAPTGKTGRPPFAVETMLRIHLLQQFFGLSAPAAEKMRYDMRLYREFARIDASYRGVNKREEVQAQHPGFEWHVAMTPAKRRGLGKRGVDAIKEHIEKIKASVRAKVGASVQSHQTQA